MTKTISGIFAHLLLYPVCKKNDYLILFIYLVSCKILFFVPKVLLILIWFILDGDLGFKLEAEKAYFKQKHRMIWERRHGKVGTGMEGNRPPNVNMEEEKK